jgi:hypothetical protein
VYSKASILLLDDVLAALEQVPLLFFFVNLLIYLQRSHRTMDY